MCVCMYVCVYQGRFKVGSHLPPSFCCCSIGPSSRLLSRRPPMRWGPLGLGYSSSKSSSNNVSNDSNDTRDTYYLSGDPSHHSS